MDLVEVLEGGDELSEDRWRVGKVHPTLIVAPDQGQAQIARTSREFGESDRQRMRREQAARTLRFKVQVPPSENPMPLPGLTR